MSAITMQTKLLESIHVISADYTPRTAFHIVWSNPSANHINNYSWPALQPGFIPLSYHTSLLPYYGTNFSMITIYSYIRQWTALLRNFVTQFSPLCITTHYERSMYKSTTAHQRTWSLQSYKTRHCSLTSNLHTQISASKPLFSDSPLTSLTLPR